MPQIRGITIPKEENIRNGFINSAFDIWQRGTSFSNPIHGDFNADRFAIEADGTLGSHVISRQEHTLGQTDVPGNPKYFWRWAHTTAGSGSTYRRVVNRIEGVQSYAGKQVTVSFYAKTGTTATMNIGYRQFFGSGGSPSALVENTNVGSASLTSSWQRFSVTFTLPSISGKTLGTDGQNGLAIQFHIPNNSVVTIDLSNIMINEGPVAATWSRLGDSLANELESCQRYFQRFDITTYNGCINVYNDGNNLDFVMQLVTQVRINPTLTFIGAQDTDYAVIGVTTGAAQTGFSFSSINTSKDSFRIRGTKAAHGQATGSYFNFRTNVGAIHVSAEL